MKYIIYTYSYQYGWELYRCETKLKQMYNVIENIDPYEYSQYIVIKRKKDRDEPFLNGIVAKPITKKKRLK